MANETQQRFYQLPSGMWVDAMTGQQAPELLYLKEAMISAASSKAQAQAAKVEREHPEQYRAWLYDETNLSLPKPSNYSTGLDVVNEFGSILQNPLDRLGVPKFKGRGVVEQALPSYYFGKGIQESRKGNAAGGLAYTALSAGTLLGDTTAAYVLPKVSNIPIIRNIPVVRKALPWLISQLPAQVGETLGLGFAENKLTNKPSTPVYPYPQTTSSVLPGNNVMTADQMERRAAAEKNRTDAAGNSGMGGRLTLETGVRASGGIPGAPAAPMQAPPPVVPLPALNPLTPDQQGQYGEELTAIDKLYKQTLADIAQQQEQGQLGYARVGQSAQRQAAGAAVDIGNQMAGSGIGSSPAAAFGAEQMVQAPLVQQRQANRLNLDQLLAQLQKQKTQAGTAMDMSKVGLNRWLTTQRANNTASQVNAGYQNFLGGM